MLYILILIFILFISVMRIEFKYKLFIFLSFMIIYLVYYKEQILFAPLLCVSAFTIIFFIFILLNKLNKKYKNTDREINVKMISFSLIIIFGTIALSYLFFIDSLRSLFFVYSSGSSLRALRNASLNPLDGTLVRICVVSYFG